MVFIRYKFNALEWNIYYIMLSSVWFNEERQVHNLHNSIAKCKQLNKLLGISIVIIALTQY